MTLARPGRPAESPSFPTATSISSVWKSFMILRSTRQPGTDSNRWKARSSCARPCSYVFAASAMATMWALMLSALTTMSYTVDGLVAGVHEDSAERMDTQLTEQLPDGH